jgi:cytochrome b6-f complex iron-sulfur subunit
MMSSTQDKPSKDSLPRRALLKGLIGFSVIATLGGVLTPIIGYLWPPARRSSGGEGRVRIASLAELQAAGGKVTPVENKPVILTYSKQGGVKAFSAICTHLGCIVQWKSSGKYIQCPCHDGRFNAQTGAVISGPPPAPLPALNVVVEGDDIYVLG